MIRSKMAERPWTPPADSTLMHQAQKENFTIFILKGIMSSVQYPRLLVADSVKKVIIAECKASIDKIKREQMRRKVARSKR